MSTEPTFICVSPVGVIVPTPDGGSKVLKRGDEITGEYYEKVYEAAAGLARKSELSKDFLAQLQKEKERKSGAMFPADLKRAADGDDPDHDSRFDGPRVDAAENLAKVFQEEKGKLHRNPNH